MPTQISNPHSNILSTGFRIDPHPDIHLKSVTAQIYLPTDNSRPHLGTTLYDVQVRRPLSVTYHRVP